MVKIEKRISLDFLGEEYADSYVKVSAIPMREIEELMDKIAEVKDSDDNKKAMEFMVSVVSERFITGEIKQGDKTEVLTADDLLDMPGEFFINVIERLSGSIPKA